MKSFFTIAVLLILALLGVCIYWYMYPHRVPSFVRNSVPGLELPKPASPMRNFRPPNF